MTKKKVPFLDVRVGGTYFGGRIFDNSNISMPLTFFEMMAELLLFREWRAVLPFVHQAGVHRVCIHISVVLWRD